MIHLDTSVMIDALTGPRRSAAALRRLLAGPELVTLSTIVLYEWLRGPRLDAEVEAQEALFPAAATAAFGPAEAAIASRLYRRLPRSRGREADFAVAACAIVHDATLWTLNRADFRDVPALKLLA